MVALVVVARNRCCRCLVVAVALCFGALQGRLVAVVRCSLCFPHFRLNRGPLWIESRDPIEGR